MLSINGWWLINSRLFWGISTCSNLHFFLKALSASASVKLYWPFTVHLHCPLLNIFFPNSAAPTKFQKPIVTFMYSKLSDDASTCEIKIFVWTILVPCPNEVQRSMKRIKIFFSLGRHAIQYVLTKFFRLITYSGYYNLVSLSLK